MLILSFVNCKKNCLKFCLVLVNDLSLSTMMREVWRQYCAEHDVLTDGKSPDKSDDGSFVETNGGLFVARNLSVDLKPNGVDDIRNGSLANLFHPQFLLNGKEDDAVNNFARGHYTVGKESIDKVNDRMRKLVDNCVTCKDLIVGNYSVGGSIGSGLDALILERMAVDYRKKYKLGFKIYIQVQ